MHSYELCYFHYFCSAIMSVNRSDWPSQAFDQNDQWQTEPWVPNFAKKESGASKCVAMQRETIYYSVGRFLCWSSL